MVYSKKYIIKLAPTFEKDLEKIYEYIAFNLQEPHIAKKLYNKIIQKLYSLQYFPERFVKIFNHKNQNLRRLLINNYAVIYEVDNNTRTSFYITYFSY